MKINHKALLTLASIFTAPVLVEASLPDTIFLDFNPQTWAPVPTKLDAAGSVGWVKDEVTDLYVNGEFPRIFLSFRGSDDTLAELLVDIPAVPFLDKKDYKTGNVHVPEGLHVEFGNTPNGLRVTVNGQKIPSHSGEAEDDGWLEGGCNPFMGGSHYYEPDYFGTTNPIYDKYGGGDGELRSFVVAGDYVGPTDNHVFDLGGAPIPFGPVACGLNLCGDPGCFETHGESLSEVVNSLHVILFPADEGDYRPCQEECIFESSGFCCGTP